MFLAGRMPLVSLARSFVTRMGDGGQKGGATSGFVTKEQIVFALKEATVRGRSSRIKPCAAVHFGRQFHEGAQFKAMNWQLMVRKLLANRLLF